MRHDDSVANYAAQMRPDRAGSSFLRTSSFPSLVLILVASLVGCRSSGSLHFEGSDPMGTFSGNVGGWHCHARFVNGTTRVYFYTHHRGDQIDLDDDGQQVHVETQGQNWKLERSECRAFDIRKWFDAKEHLHVVVQLVDCTSPDGVRVEGSLRSDACDVERPH
jgi:hypothetical protein